VFIGFLVPDVAVVFCPIDNGGVHGVEVKEAVVAEDNWGGIGAEAGHRERIILWYIKIYNCIWKNRLLTIVLTVDLSYFIKIH